MTVRSYLMGWPPDPQAAPVSNTYRWATVTDNSPLEIQLDGDSLPLAAVPDCLMDPLALGVGDRVWTQLYGRKVIVHGAAGGGTGPHALPNEIIGWHNPAAGNYTMSSLSWVDWPQGASGGPLEVTHVKRNQSSRIVVSYTATHWAEATGDINYGVLIDGTTDVDLTFGYHNSIQDHRQWAAMRLMGYLDAGSHTYRLRAHTNGNQVMYDYNDTFSLSIREIVTQ